MCFKRYAMTRVFAYVFQCGLYIIISLEWLHSRYQWRRDPDVMVLD